MSLKQRLALVVTAVVVAIGAGIGLWFVVGPGAAGPEGGRDAPAAFDTDELVTALADGLDLDADTVRAALEEAMSGAGRGGAPSDGGTPPSGSPTGRPERGDGQEQGGGLASRIASPLAESLGVDEPTVLEILEEHLPSGGGGPSGGR